VPSVKSHQVPSPLVSTAPHLLKTLRLSLFTMAKGLPQRYFSINPAQHLLTSRAPSGDLSS
jgi:hypothetical protein